MQRHLYFFGFLEMGGDRWVLCICMCHVDTSYNCVACTLVHIGGAAKMLFHPNVTKHRFGDTETVLHAEKCSRSWSLS